MSVKWTANRSDSGILRKSEFKEKKEELFVFGYSCKLFRDNEKALHIDQGKHLIPWMGDETLKIDRYDARGALHDLSTLEAPPGGYDWRVELTRTEQDVEQLCDEERYRALHTDEDEEEMYKEEELKRLHAAGYGQVGFNYDAPKEPEPASQPAEVDEPFLPTPAFKALLPTDMLLPESLKQNAIIEKTAKFIASQGAQMEILIKAKQGDNPQFQFLNKDCPLNAYYSALIGLIKAGKWPEKEQQEVVEDKPPENEEYLHPSLASTIIESAPSIPSIHYKPSADCDYTMLISKMRGEATIDEAYAPELAPGEVAPPGTEPLPPRANAEISRAPVMYNRHEPGPEHNHTPTHTAQYQQYAAYYHQYLAQAAAQQVQRPPPVSTDPTPVSSTGLSLMKNYNTDSETDDEDYDDSSSTEEPIATPPEDVQVVIDKMAEYVARNGDEFAEIVRSKNDPRFTFLEPNNVYHAYYKRLMQQKRGIDVNGKGKEGKKKATAPVSFSIKKLKEPDPILPKPALPYESSTDEESEKTEKSDEPKESPKPLQHPTVPIIPPVIVYKIENPVTEIPVIKPVEPLTPIPKPVVEEKEVPIEESIVQNDLKPPPTVEEVKVKSPTPEEKKPQENVERDSPKKEKRRHRDRKKEYRSKSATVESKRTERSNDREKKKEKDGDRERKRLRHSREELESEIISLVDTTDDLIDLTGDQSDSKSGEVETEADKAKQQERRRRAAEFLKKVGVDPAAAALPTSSLASAMVDTLESLRKKKAEEEEKRRKREKRRHRERYEYEDGSERSHNSHRKSKRRKYKSSDDNEESDYDGSKKKKRKKDKKHSSKTKKKRRREPEMEEQEVIDIPLNMDLTNTLKELRHTSPTRELVLEMEDSQHSFARQASSGDEEKVVRGERKKKKEDREYSEGEWSSDSEQDSGTSASAKEEY